MCRWLARELGPDVPLHFSRFVPTYMLKNVPPTPPATLHEARRIAMDAGIRFCYVGNLLSDAEHTYCPSCGKVLLRRLMYSVENEGLQGRPLPLLQTRRSPASFPERRKPPRPAAPGLFISVAFVI